MWAQVKTTAPKSYLVRPSAATLRFGTFTSSLRHENSAHTFRQDFCKLASPHGSEEVTIILQPRA